MNSSSPMSNPFVPSDAPESHSLWQRGKFLFKVVEIRLRFIAVLVIVFLLIRYWDTLWNYWDKFTRPHVAIREVSADQEFYCPMHPQVTRAGLEPNGSTPNCPIGGIPLAIPAKGHPVELPAGVTARVQLSPDRIQIAGIRTVAAEYHELNKEIRAVGNIDYDESRRSQIVARVGGYVEKLMVNSTFTSVNQGEPLAEIFSPELYSTVQELLLANKRGGGMVDSGRERLRLLGIDDKEIDAILQRSMANNRLVIRAPASGHVIEKKIVQGSRVEAGMTLFEIADLSVVWVEADVFEKDVPLLRRNQEVVATVESLPNRPFHGKVTLVHPHLETGTRTNRVRIALENDDHILRPGMYATVTINVPLADIEPYRTQLAERRSAPAANDDATLIEFQKVCPVTGLKLGSMGKPIKVQHGDRTVFLCCKGCPDKFAAQPEKYLAKLAPPPENGILAVPEQAVIDTGSKKIVYVQTDPGVFEGRLVQTGPRVGEFVPIVSGIYVGDHVAAAGAFLVDAETRLNPAAAAMYSGGGGPAKAAGSAATTATASTSSSGGSADSSPPLEAITEEALKEVAKLPPDERRLALAQRYCPITRLPLGKMGMPARVQIKGKTIFLCCDGCIEEAQKTPDETLSKLKDLEQIISPPGSTKN